MLQKGPHFYTEKEQAKPPAWQNREQRQGPCLHDHTSTHMIYPPAQIRPGTHKHHGNRKPQLSQGHITWGATLHKQELFLFPVLITSHFRDTYFLFLGVNCLIKLSTLSALPTFYKKKKGNEVKPNRTVRVTKTKFIHTAFLLDQNIRTNVMVWFFFFFFLTGSHM